MISVCIPTYNRFNLLLECIAPFLEDDRVTEIVIVDDCSDMNIYKNIEIYCMQYAKVRLYRNEKNLDCALNKKRCVELATNDWVLLADSDNVFSKEFIDTIFNERHINPVTQENTWSRLMIYQPSFAKPHFDFTAFEGKHISFMNVAFFMMQHQFQTMLNAANCFFHREEWLGVFDSSIDPVTSDSIYQNYRWLEAGNSIYVVPGLHYEHRVSNHGKEEKSHYVQKNRKTPKGFHESIVNKLKAMR